MRVVFVFAESDVVNNFLEVEIDWDCPFLPRLGEVINASIFMLKLTPKEFYESLTEEAKIEWDEWVKERLDYFDGNIEEAEKDCMTEWFLNMDMCVKGIYWDVDEKGIRPSSPLQKPTIFWSKGIRHVNIGTIGRIISKLPLSLHS